MLGTRALLLPALAVLLAGCAGSGPAGPRGSLAGGPPLPSPTPVVSVRAAPPGGMGPGSLVLSSTSATPTASPAPPAASPTPAATATPRPRPTATATAQAQPGAAATPAPAADQMRVILPALPPAQRGGAARVRALTSPGALCTLTIQARPAEPSTFGPRRAGEGGAVAWTLTISRHDRPGTWSVTVGCHAGGADASAERTLEVR